MKIGVKVDGQGQAGVNICDNNDCVSNCCLFWWWRRKKK